MMCIHSNNEIAKRINVSKIAMFLFDTVGFASLKKYHSFFYWFILPVKKFAVFHPASCTKLLWCLK